MTAFRLVAATLLALAAAAPAQAQTTVHRSNAPAGEAAPTGGSFSIRFPVDFSDVEMKVPDPNAPTLVVHMLTGITGEKLRFSATEIPQQGPPKPLDSFMDEAKRRPGAVVSDIQRGQKEGVETLSYALTEPNDGTYFRVIRTKTTGYLLVIQYPRTLFNKAAGLKDEFFNSFKITKP